MANHVGGPPRGSLRTCPLAHAPYGCVGPRLPIESDIGLAICSRGALLVADDVGNVIWRVTPAR